MKINTNIIIAGIISLAAIEIVALLCGVNGTLMAIVIAVIAGAIGVTIPTPKVLAGGK